MVKSRYRSGIHQYIKDKPTKWGIKLWVLADSSNAYTVDLDIYGILVFMAGVMMLL